MNSQLFLSKLKQFWIWDLSCTSILTILTPSHLVIGRRFLTLPVGPLQIDDWDFGDHLTATKRSRYLADRIQHFRRRWQREYLVELREFHRPKGKNVMLPPVRINDVVILHDQGTSQRGALEACENYTFDQRKRWKSSRSMSVSCRKEDSYRETPSRVVSSGSSC